MVFPKTLKKATKKPAKAKKPAKKPLAELTNRIAIVVDQSSSMNVHRQGVLALLNSRIESIRAQQDKDAQIEIVYFDDSARVQVPLSRVSDLQPVTNYTPRGMTALRDGVAMAIKDLEKDGHVYLVIVITDGEENQSRGINQKDFVELLRAKQATDLWTFAFLVPPGTKVRAAAAMGLPEGNVTEWNDVSKAAQSLDAGMSEWYKQRRSGATSVKNFFEVDLSGLTSDQVGRLPVFQATRILTVDKEVAIQEFIEANGLAFSKGCAHYQLSKRETIQDYKNILIMENGKRTVHSGARGLLGMPTTGDTTVNPKNFNGFAVFVESTSTNRKLVRGTKVIYKA